MNDSDKELLQLAAKAAGYEIGVYAENVQGFGGQFWCREDKTVHLNWNPLENDADAFRLLVKLGLRIDAGCVYGWNNGLTFEYLFPENKPTTAEVRRAICRCAAEIGGSL